MFHKGEIVMNLTIALSILGAITGITSFIISLVIIYRTKTVLALKIIDTYPVNKNDYFGFDLLVTNCSSLPISINNIKITDYKNREIECYQNRRYLGSSHLGDETLETVISSVLPISLKPYESQRGIYLFECKDKSLFPHPYKEDISKSKYWRITLTTSRHTKEFKIIAPTTKEFYKPKFPTIFFDTKE